MNHMNIMTGFPEIFESDIFFGVHCNHHDQFLLNEKYSVNLKVIARTF